MLEKEPVKVNWLQQLVQLILKTLNLTCHWFLQAPWQFNKQLRISKFLKIKHDVWYNRVFALIVCSDAKEAAAVIVGMYMEQKTCKRSCNYG